jgi:beta-galactosidase
MYGDPKFETVSVRAEVFEKDSGKKVAEATVETDAKRENFSVAGLDLELAQPHLWSPDDPFLYTTKTSVILDGKVIDLQEDQFGMRDFERRGKYFYLNDEKILLRGTNITLQRFFEDPDCGNLAWNRDWVKQLIIDDPKKINWNAMRICVGIVPDFWYDLADEYGMMFQNEWNYWQPMGGMSRSELNIPTGCGAMAITRVSSFGMPSMKTGILTLAMSLSRNCKSWIRPGYGMRAI